MNSNNAISLLQSHELHHHVQISFNTHMLNSWHVYNKKNGIAHFHAHENEEYFFRGLFFDLTTLFVVTGNLAVDSWFILSIFCHLIMNRLMQEQRLEIVQIYFDNQGAVRVTDW